MPPVANDEAIPSGIRALLDLELQVSRRLNVWAYTTQGFGAGVLLMAAIFGGPEYWSPARLFALACTGAALLIYIFRQRFLMRDLDEQIRMYFDSLDPESRKSQQDRYWRLSDRYNL